MANEVEQFRQAFAEGKERVDALFERINSELDFVEKLAQLNPEKAEEWRALAGQAAAKVTEAAAGNCQADLEQAIAQAEVLLAPVGEVAKSYEVYCIGHAHIDMNWMWSWPETVAVANDSFSTVLKLMEEYPDFVFSQSQASTYRIIEEHNPAMLEQIKQRVKEGRWEITASHWVEGDKNIASAESLCRHLLYTREYMAKLFDLAPEDVPVDWAPDTFGHAHTMPTYLVRGGVKYVYLHRPGGEGPKRPRAFWWQGPDGSRVLVKNDMECGYNGAISPGSVQIMFNFCQETGLKFGLYVYGVGDHGGGPTRRDILRGYDMNTWPIYPTFKFATLKSFLERLEAEGGATLPTLDCELNFEFTGCYTTQTLVKKANRLAEARLQDAEFAATAAWGALGLEYRNCKFIEGWRDTLFSHFHDILPGSGVHDTRTYTHGLFQKTMAMTSQEETQSLRALAAAIDTSGFGKWELPASPSFRLRTSLGSGVGMGAQDGGLSQAEQSAGSGNRPFVLFNPTDVERDEVVVATVWDNAWSWRHHELRHMQFSVRTPGGELLPAQTIDTGSYWGHDFVKLAFPAKVGKWGYAVYSIEEHGAPGSEASLCQLGINHHCGYSMYERSPEGLENEFIRLEIDTETGGIKSLVEKASGATIISACKPALPLEYGVERPHGMTAWLVDHTGGWEAPELLMITRKLSGPYKASVDVRLRIHESEFTLTYEVRKGDPNLYLDLNGTWFERGTPATGVPVLRLALAARAVRGAGELRDPLRGYRSFDEIWRGSPSLALGPGRRQVG